MVTPINPKSAVSTASIHLPSQTTGQATMKFTIPSIATLHTSTFAQGFSNNEHQVAARALLRHDVRIDGTHYQARQPGGLHPSYFGFSGTAKQTAERSLTHEELLEASLQDVFNAVFAQEFAMPHHKRFNQCCIVENIQPPQHFAAAHICVKGPQYLPGPVVATGAHIKCSAQPASTFTNELQTTTTHDSPSAAIRGGAEMGAGLGKKFSPLPTTPHAQVHRRRHADTFMPGKVIGEGPIFSVPKLEQDTAFYAGGMPLISIGPNTDVAMDQIKLGDKILPKLRVLVQTVCSSRWEAVLRSPKWDISYKHASILSQALLVDLQGTPPSPDVVKITVPL
ncbi:hypothetical protein DEU56DRAFT_752872 [Suillus clintonianus]|uniref:uncharacterized protein n=1 Tax=Suillus clintonianus TaxID=1904413 RepID=UPI001B87E538|nr:uncharacterized protein DEU56DRAFT_752872 [Suillus clintonianus]KAG2149220.1 hypothetical protein DEU56DRAFT_752872 [Suillus clintonianus]